MTPQPIERRYTRIGRGRKLHLMRHGSQTRTACGLGRSFGPLETIITDTREPHTMPDMCNVCRAHDLNRQRREEQRR